MTLIELLVVVSILLLLVLVAIPAVRPGLENQRLREAARMVNVILGNARNRAEESGRPYGVEIERATGQPLASVRLYQVEIPPPYAGDTTGAAVRIQDWTVAAYNPAPVPWWPDGSLVLKVKVRSGDFAPGLIRYGDQIQFNYQGLVYTIVRDLKPPPSNVPPATPYIEYPVDAQGFIDFNPGPAKDIDGDGFIDNYVLTVCADPRQGATGTWRNWECKPGDSSPQWANWSAPPVPFAIRRQPARTAVAPVLLPRGTAIDLAYSGTTFAPRAGTLDPTSSVRLLFSPNGAVDRVYWLSSGAQRATEPIYLLVGRRDRAQGGIPPEDGLNNLQDLNNFWIAIQPQTGLTTTDNVADSTGVTPLDAAIAASRALATPAQAVGGR